MLWWDLEFPKSSEQGTAFLRTGLGFVLTLPVTLQDFILSFQERWTVHQSFEELGTIKEDVVFRLFLLAHYQTNYQLLLEDLQSFHVHL